jgi:hypothetical protein
MLRFFSYTKDSAFTYSKEDKYCQLSVSQQFDGNRVMEFTKENQEIVKMIVVCFFVAVKTNVHICERG